MLVKKYLKLARAMSYRGQQRSWGTSESWWTHLLVSDEKPEEFPFCREDMDAVEAEGAAMVQEQAQGLQ